MTKFTITLDSESVAEAVSEYLNRKGYEIGPSEVKLYGDNDSAGAVVAVTESPKRAKATLPFIPCPVPGFD